MSKEFKKKSKNEKNFDQFPWLNNNIIYVNEIKFNKVTESQSFEINNLIKDKKYQFNNSIQLRKIRLKN